MKKPQSPLEPDWRLIRAFVAVMQEGTLSAAARRLGATQPTVGRQIRALESLVGDVLFLRRGATLEPTEAALELFPRARDVERAVASLGRAFAGKADADAPRTVRLTSPTLLADEMLPALFPALRAAAPRATFNVWPSDRVQDLFRRDADIALRMVEPTQPDLIARRIARVSVGFFATRDYIERWGAPRSAAELAEHCLILPEDDVQVERAAARSKLDALRPSQLIRSNDLRHRLALLRAGVGVSTCHDWIGRKDARLVRVLPELELARLDLWLVTTDDVHRSRTLRRVADALGDLVEEFVDPART